MTAVRGGAQPLPGRRPAEQARGQETREQASHEGVTGADGVGDAHRMRGDGVPPARGPVGHGARCAPGEDDQGGAATRPANPRHERRDRARLARVQRELSRKAKGSSNRAKARVKVARVHARIADRRRDFLHKLSTRLVRENQTVVIEDLTVRNLLKNGKLARAISDAAWTDLRFMLEYKCAWYGRELVVIDRWFPSSKPCGTCGTVAAKLPLNVREWRCDCGAVHDRDVNAARNILAAGLAASACGDGVRPQRESSRTGRSSAKQEPQRATAGIPRH